MTKGNSFKGVKKNPNKKELSNSLGCGYIKHPLASTELINQEGFLGEEGAPRQ